MRMLLVDASEKPGASFDCRKAATAGEMYVCASAAQRPMADRAFMRGIAIGIAIVVPFWLGLVAALLHAL